MKTYSNPLMHLEVNDWPYGSKRVKAVFTVESGPRGERVSRITENPRGGWNKPKATTYALKARIVTGDDGRTYIAELTQYGHITMMQSNLQYSEESRFPDHDGYADLLELFK